MLALFLSLTLVYFALWGAAEAFNRFAGYPVFFYPTPARLWPHVKRFLGFLWSALRNPRGLP